MHAAAAALKFHSRWGIVSLRPFAKVIIAVCNADTSGFAVRSTASPELVRFLHSIVGPALARG
jgi:hypothetical protein